MVSKSHHRGSVKASLLKKYGSLRPRRTIAPWKTWLLGAVSVFSLYVGINIAWSGLTSARALDWKSLLVPPVMQGAQSVETSDDYEVTNFLLLWYGGGKHEGSDLTDTMLLASFHHEYKTLTLVSIPRDLEVRTKDGGYGRLNAVYRNDRLKKDDTPWKEAIRSAIEKITGQPIQYTVMIDFSGFQKVIDALGGVQVNVENDFVDHMYPVEETHGYKTVRFQQWLQTMDGQTALEYARSRHAGGKEGTDFARSARQQNLLRAVQNQLLSADVLTSPSKIRDLYDVVSQQISTDVSVSDALALAAEMRSMDKDSVTSHNLTSDGDGFLYAPEMSTTGGMYLLRPTDPSYNDIHDFIRFITEYPLAFKNQPTIEILSGLKNRTILSRCKNKIENYGFHSVTRTGWTPEKKVSSGSFLIVHTETPYTQTVALLEKITGAWLVDHFAEPITYQADITLILGEDQQCILPPKKRDTTRSGLKSSESTEE